MTFLSHSVRDFRLKMMRDLMKRDRLDALIFTTADFFQFATNFHVDVQPWERPILACVTLEGEPQAIMNELSTHHMMMAKERGHVWVKDVQFYSEHPKVAERQFLLPQLPEMIAEFLRKLGLSSSRIGVDGSFSALARAAAEAYLGRLDPDAVAAAAADPARPATAWAMRAVRGRRPKQNGSSSASTRFPRRDRPRTTHHLRAQRQVGLHPTKRHGESRMGHVLDTAHCASRGAWFGLG